MTLDTPDRSILLEDLPDDLAEIARQIPPSPRGLGYLRQTMALLPPPLAATTPAALPADELIPPQDAASILGTQPGADNLGFGALGDGSVSARTIRPGSIDDIAKFAATIRPPVVVSALPALPDANYPDGSFVYLTTDEHLYQNNSGTWVATGDATLIVGQITAGQIAAGAIGTDELAAGAITAVKIAANELHMGLFRDQALNLVPNPGWELDGNTALGDPLTNWTPASGDANQWETSPGHAGTGNGAYMLRGVQKSTPEAVQLTSDFFPVVAGARYRRRVATRGDAGNSGTATARLRWRYYNEAKGQIVSASSSVVVGSSSSLQWIEGIGVADVLAAYARVEVEVDAASAAGDVVYFNDAEFYRVDHDISHAAGDVLIDSTGITITNGKLTLQDEFGKTTLVASGFTGSWSDFIRLGLYNARFVDIKVGALAAGRTVDCPYWNIQDITGSPVATGLSGGGVKVTFGAVNDKQRLDSDKVPVRPASVMEAGFAVGITRAAGTLSVNAWVYWYDAADSLISAQILQGINATATISGVEWALDSVVAPDTAVSAFMRIEISESGSHSASNQVTLYGARFIDQVVTIPPYQRYGDQTVGSANPGSGTVNNWNPGTQNEKGILNLSPSGNVVLTGILAPPRPSKRVMILRNGSSFHVTLTHEDTGSTAANRFTLPNGVDVVLSTTGGMVKLYYDDGGSRWVVIGGYGTKAISEVADMRVGKQSVTPVTDTPTSASVSLSLFGTSIRSFWCTANSAVPGSQVVEVSVGSTTLASMNIVIYRHNTTATELGWGAYSI